MSFPKGHKRLYLEHNNERSREESAWSWECECGAQESAHLKVDAQFEWRMHLETVKRRATVVVS